MHSTTGSLYGHDRVWMEDVRRMNATTALTDAWMRIDRAATLETRSESSLIAASLVIMERVMDPEITPWARLNNLDHAIDATVRYRVSCLLPHELPVTTDLHELRETVAASIPQLRRPGDVIATLYTPPREPGVVENVLGNDEPTVAMLYTPPSAPGEKGIIVPTDRVSVFQRTYGLPRPKNRAGETPMQGG